MIPHMTCGNPNLNYFKKTTQPPIIPPFCEMGAGNSSVWVDGGQAALAADGRARIPRAETPCWGWRWRQQRHRTPPGQGREEGRPCWVVHSQGRTLGLTAKAHPEEGLDSCCSAKSKQTQPSDPLD